MSDQANPLAAVGIVPAFSVQPFDPYDLAVQEFTKFNQTPEGQREYTEAQLIQLMANQIRHHDR